MMIMLGVWGWRQNWVKETTNSQEHLSWMEDFFFKCKNRLSRWRWCCCKIYKQERHGREKGRIDFELRRRMLFSEENGQLEGIIAKVIADFRICVIGILPISLSSSEPSLSSFHSSQEVFALSSSSVSSQVFFAQRLRGRFLGIQRGWEDNLFPRNIHGSFTPSSAKSGEDPLDAFSLANCLLGKARTRRREHMYSRSPLFCILIPVLWNLVFALYFVADWKRNCRHFLANKCFQVLKLLQLIAGGAYTRISLAFVVCLHACSLSIYFLLAPYGPGAAYLFQPFLFLDPLSSRKTFICNLLQSFSFFYFLRLSSLFRL